MLIVRDQRERVIALQSTTPPALEWANAAESYERMDEIDATLDPDAPERDHPAVYLAQLPAPQLRINDPAFALNAFFLGVWFMSNRMRAALGLADADIVVRAADIVGGAPQLSALGYAAVAPVHHGDGIDPDRSDVEVFGEAGASTSHWALAIRGDVLPKVGLRSGFLPPAPLFYMDRTDWLMITREAAERVRSACIDDVSFEEPGPAYGSWMTSRPEGL